MIQMVLNFSLETMEPKRNRIFLKCRKTSSTKNCIPGENVSKDLSLIKIFWDERSLNSVNYLKEWLR